MKKIVLCFVIISMLLGVVGCKNEPVVTEITEKLVSNEYLKTERVLSSYNEDSTLKGRFLEEIKDIATSELYEKNYQVKSSYINYGDYAIVIGDGSYNEKTKNIQQSEELYIIDKNNNKCLLKKFDKEIYQISIKDKAKIVCIVNSTQNYTDREYIEYDLFTGEEKVLVEKTRDLYFYHNNVLYQLDEFRNLVEMKDDIADKRTLYTNVSSVYRSGNDLIILHYEQKNIVKYDGKNTEIIKTEDENQTYADGNIAYEFLNAGQIEIYNQKNNTKTILKYNNIKGYTFIEMVGDYYISQYYDAESQPKNFLIDLKNGNKFKIEEFVLNSTNSDIFIFNNKIYFYNVRKNGWNDKQCYPKLMSLDLSQLDEMNSEKLYNDYLYKEENGYIKITNHNYTEGEKIINIPAEIDGIPVKVIGDSAFYQNKDAEEINIPESVVTIESGAFYRCYSLKSINISENVIYIEDNIFFRCPSLKGINVDEKNKNYCDIEGVLFNKEKNILLVYPEGSRNESYTVPESVEKIEDVAFGYSCEYLKKIAFSKNIKKIGYNPFSLYENLESIFVDDSNQYYTSENGILFSKDMSVLIAYPNNKKEKEYIIPNSVNKIESFSFGYINSLQHIVIPKSVNLIGDGDVFVNYVVLRVEKGSVAEKYAIENNITFEYIE